MNIGAVAAWCPLQTQADAHHGDVMNTIYLLGAGASADADLPLARELTQRMIDALSAKTAQAELASALNYVVGSIVAFDARSGTRPDLLPDIERVVSAVELLSNRDSLEVAPFAQWDAPVTALDRGGYRTAPPLWDSSFRDALTDQRTGRGGPDARKIRQLVEQLIERRDEPRDLFNRLHQALLRGLVEVLDVDPTKCDYLRPLIAQAQDRPLAVATLNYDVTVETAAMAAGVPCADGVTTWAEDGALSWPDQGVRLMKLHGSLTWGRGSSRSDGDVMRLPDIAVTQRQARDLPFLIFGRREKLRPEGPFLQLLESFRDALSQSNRLVVVGYGWRDDHINSLVARWINGLEQRRLVVVDPRFPERASVTRAATYAETLTSWLTVRAPGAPLGDPPARSRLVVIRQSARDFFAGAATGLDEHIHASADPSTVAAGDAAQ